MNVDTLYNRESIDRSLDEIHQQVAQHFTAVSSDDFFVLPTGGWSPAGKLEHLIKSVSAVVNALKTPKFLVRLMFGSPRRPSRRFPEIRDAYLDQLMKGAQATGPYIPAQTIPETDPDGRKAMMLSKWLQKGHDLRAALQKWDENDLDRHYLPHPILGKLTVREMLFFTLYHPLHHLKERQTPAPPEQS